MERRIDWAAIPLVFEFLNVKDPESVIEALIHVKEISDKKAEGEAARR